MKRTLSLSLKLTLIVFILSAVTILSITLTNIQEQTSFFQDSYSNKAEALAQALDARISSRADLEDEEQLHTYVLKFIYHNPEVLKISISLPEDDELIVAVSSDANIKGTVANEQNAYSYKTGNTSSISNHKRDSYILTVTTPLHLSGQVEGAYEMILSMDEAYADLNSQILTSITISITWFVVLIISFIYVLRRLIINPIRKFRDATSRIGEGKLDTEIKINSRDELGDLALAFNRMTTDLKKSREEIEQYSKTLEKKVDNRTKELNASKEDLRLKVEALERNKIAMVNIMGDLKNTIAELEEAEEEIGEKNIDLKKAQKELSSLNKNLEQKVKERTREVEKLLNQKDEFVRQLGHDLKNPLVPISNLLSVFKKRIADPELLKFTDIMVQRVEYMKKLVTDILELARLNSASIKFNKENLNLLEITEQVVRDNKLLFEENNVDIKNMVSEDIVVNADKLKLEELLSNISSNAVKYLQKGGSIEIDAKEGKKYITVSVKDTGIGMTKEQIEHIFEEFYKADWSRHDRDSSGLGLSICKRIVEKHNGKIWAESKGKDKGSTFCFTIPKGKLK